MWVFVDEGANVVDGFVGCGPFGADAVEVGTDGGDGDAEAAGDGGEGAAGAVEVEDVEFLGG